MKKQFRLMAALIFTAVLAYSALWYTAAFRAEKDAAAKLASLRDQGQKIEHGKIALSGFPYRIVVTVHDFSFAPNSRAVRFDVGKVDLVTHLWTPGHWVLQGEDAILRNASGSLIIRDGTLRASVRSAPDGNMVIGLDSYQTSDFLIERAPGLPDDMSLTAWQLFLRIHADDSNSNDALYGDRILDFKITANARTHTYDFSGGISGPAMIDWSERSLSTWRDEGGFLELDAIDIAFRGNRLKGSGSLSLDEELRFLGSIGLTAAGDGKLSGLFSEKSKIKRRIAALEPLTGELSFLIQNGQVSLGGELISKFDSITD